MEIAIYALCEPGTGAVRYVGKAENPERRTHLRAMGGRRTHKNCWLQALRTRGQQPVLRVLEWVPAEQWQVVERSWIRQLRLMGCNLTNGTDGGDGGYIPAAQTPEARAKRSKSHMGLVVSVETRAKISQTKRGQPKLGGAPPPVMRGVEQPLAKLTDELVAELRRHVKAGGELLPWATAHGVTVACASYAARGATWKHVTEAPRLSKPRLTADDISEIRRLCAEGISQGEVARRFGVSQSHVSSVVLRKRHART